MSNTDINLKKDLEPFKYIINDIEKLYKSYNDVKKIIPEIYYKEYIDNFFDIKKNIRELEIIKNFILSILESSKYELEKIEIFLDDFDINEEKYILKKKNYINEFKNQSDFDIFVNSFLLNNNLFNSKKYKNIQSFSYIFQDKCDVKNKVFFSNLFRKHLKISEYLYEKIYEYQGILAFDKIYELSELLILSKIDNIEKNTDKNNIKNKSNNNYRLLGHNLEYYNNKNIENNKNNKSNKKKDEPTLLPKINKFNLLYINNSIDYYNNQYNKNINNIFNELLKSKNNLFKSNNLYLVTTNLLLLDFYNINFIFNYYDQTVFSNFIVQHIEVNKYIYDKINIFENYYLDYIEWKFSGNKTTKHDLVLSDDKSFESFYNNYTK